VYELPCFVSPGCKGKLENTEIISQGSNWGSRAPPFTWSVVLSGLQAEPAFRLQAPWAKIWGFKGSREPSSPLSFRTLLNGGSPIGFSGSGISLIWRPGFRIWEERRSEIWDCNEQDTGYSGFTMQDSGNVVVKNPYPVTTH